MKGLQMPLVALFGRSLGLLPAWVLRWLSRPLGWVAWRLSNTRRNTTLRNLAACYPTMDAPAREATGRESMRHFILTALESGMCWSWSRPRLERHFVQPDGLDLLDAAMAEGRGVLALVPHFGNWELLNHWAQFRFELLALYKPGGSPELESRMVRNRRRFGAQMVPTSGKGLKQLYRHLRAGGLAAILPDQDPSDGRGHFVPFFGVPALTGVLAVRLLQQTGCRAIFAAARRLPGSRYQPHIIAPEPDLYSSDADRALAALNRGIERVVALDPPQYLWAYKRFKSRPEGEPPFY
jgi:KDO2-lipid IV(A) lauroyltransferase